MNSLDDKKSIVPMIIVILSLGELGELFEGDILIADNPKVEKRDTMMMVQDMPLEGSGMDDTVNMDKIAGNLWPDKTVYYKFDDDLSKTKYSV